MINRKSDAYAAMNAYMRAYDPFKRAKSETVTIEVRSVLPSHPFFCCAGCLLAAVEVGKSVHFIGRQVFRDHSHLLADVILAYALSEGRKLALDISGLLILKRRRAEFFAGRAVAGCTRGNCAMWISDIHQSGSRITFLQAPRQLAVLPRAE